MNKKQAKRLLKLADHIVDPAKRGLGKFDFSRIMDRYPLCGTVGCALGECPTAFPKQWTRRVYNNCSAHEAFVSYAVSLKSHFGEGPFGSAQIFFGLTEDETFALFQPFSQFYIQPSLPNLGSKATPKEVAANIRVFIRRKGYTLKSLRGKL